jgi:ATP-dependent RNA helicase MSS116
MRGVECMLSELPATHMARHSALFANNPSSYRSDDDDNGAPTKSPPRRGRIRPLRRGNQLSNRASTIEDTKLENARRRQIAAQDPNLLVDQLYADVVSPKTARALTERIGVERMTLVQGRTLALALSGESLLVRARVGTGKTLGFLVPLVERLVSMDPTQFQAGREIGALVVVPTVELCRQIAETCDSLLSFHPTISVRAIFGGTSIQHDIRSLQRGLPAIMVATPGRLLDLAQNGRIRGQKFSDLLSGTSMIVLDEADHLFISFKKDIQKILSYLPRKRQTLMFSATMPKRLRTSLPELFVTAQWTDVDCIEENNDEKLRIEQHFTSLNTIEEYVPSVLCLVKSLLGSNLRDNYKVMMFFPAVRMVRFVGDIMRDCMKDVTVWEIHSQMSQSSRRRVADAFRNTKGGLLLTSDVSARGLDYPDVDLVVQFGLPSSRQLYLHRIGRTGRAGRTGESLLVLMPFESLRALGRQRREEITEFDGSCFESDSISAVSGELNLIRSKIRSKQLPLFKSGEGFILAFLAYYAVHKPSALEPSHIRAHGEALALSIGMDSAPPLSDSLNESLL